MAPTMADSATVSATTVALEAQAAEVEGGPPGLRMTVSMGLAEHQPGEAVELTLDRADKALYAAKANGRDCCRAADDSRDTH